MSYVGFKKLLKHLAKNSGSIMAQALQVQKKEIKIYLKKINNNNNNSVLINRAIIHLFAFHMLFAKYVYDYLYCRSLMQLFFQKNYLALRQDCGR